MSKQNRRLVTTQPTFPISDVVNLFLFPQIFLNSLYIFKLDDVISRGRRQASFAIIASKYIHRRRWSMIMAASIFAFRLPSETALLLARF